jgi:copper transport protein
MQSGVKRFLAAGFVVVGIMLGMAAPASAHAVLQSTDPPAGAALNKSPGQVVLHFGEPVEIQFGAVRVFNSDAKRVDSGSSFHPKGDSHAAATTVPDNLPSGGYVVTWRVISADSHPVHGAFTFRIGQAAGAGTTSLKDEAAKLLSAGGGSVTVGAAFAVVRLLVFASLLVFAGAVTFLGWAWPAGTADRRARVLTWWALVAAIVTTAAAFALQGPYGGALPMGDALKPSVLSAVWHTRFGHVHVLALVLLGLAGLLVAMLFSRTSRPSWWRPAAVAVGVPLLLTPGLAGHAGVGIQVPLALAMDLVHVGAAAVWLGGLSMLAFAVLPGVRSADGQAADGPLATAVPAFSQWAFGAVVAIVITGLYASWRQVGTLSGVTGTTYGRLLLVKTIAVVALVALASLSRRAVHGRLALPRFALRRPQPALSRGPGAMARGPATRVSQLRRAVLAELAVAAVVLGVTALLVNAQPARAALAVPYSTEVKAGDKLLVDVVVAPAKAGPLAVHLYVLTPDGAQADVPQVTATLSMPRSAIDQITVPLAKAGVGHFAAYGVDVPIRGTWSLLIVVRTSNIDEVAAAPVNVPIR